MSRATFLGLSFLFLAGCQTGPDRLPVKHLPEDSPPLPYAELLTRSRLLASTATEAFYVDRWDDLEEAARGLDQTARFFNKAIEVPVKHKTSLPAESASLAKEAGKLLEAAKTKNDKQTNETLQRINLMVRELRLE